MEAMPPSGGRRVPQELQGAYVRKHELSRLIYCIACVGFLQLVVVLTLVAVLVIGGNRIDLVENKAVYLVSHEHIMALFKSVSEDPETRESLMGIVNGALTQVLGEIQLGIQTHHHKRDEPMYDGPMPLE